MKVMIKIDTDRFIETIADGIQDVFPYALDATAALEAARKITEAGDFVRELERLAQSVMDQQKKRLLCALEEMREPEEPHECWFEFDWPGDKFRCSCGKEIIVSPSERERQANAMRHLNEHMLDWAAGAHAKQTVADGLISTWAVPFSAAAKAMRMGQ